MAKPPDIGLAYINSLGGDNQKSQRSVLRQAGKMLGSEWDVLPWEKIQPSRITTLVNAWKRDFLPRTARYKIGTIRRLYRFIEREGLITTQRLDRIIAGSEPPKLHAQKGGKGRALSEEERVTIMSLPVVTQYERLTWAVLVTLLLTGIRVTELCELTWDDVDEVKGRFWIRHAKGHTERAIPMHEFVLLAWKLTRDDQSGADARIFQNRNQRIGMWTPLNRNLVLQMVNRMTRRHKIEHFSPHDLRRTYITYALNIGIDVATVSKLVGHASVNTTLTYDMRDEEAKDKAMAKMSTEILAESEKMGVDIGSQRAGVQDQPDPGGRESGRATGDAEERGQSGPRADGSGSRPRAQVAGDSNVDGHAEAPTNRGTPPVG